MAKFLKDYQLLSQDDDNVRIKTKKKKFKEDDIKSTKKKTKKWKNDF